MSMESRGLKQTTYSFVILMLSLQTLLTAQQIQSYHEMQVGVILDMGSRVGKVIYDCITMATSDFYEANPHYKTRIVFDTTDTKGDPLIAISAALDLLKNTKVQAIIGPDPTVEARFLGVLEEKTSKPILSFSKSLSNQNPHLLQITEDETTQFKGIAAMIETFKSDDIVLICEDTPDGREMAAYIIMRFHDKNIHVTYTSQISPVAGNVQIHEEFHKFQDMQTATFVIHTRPSLASNIFSWAKEVGLMGEGYTWIVTSKTTNFLKFMNDDALESMQGVVGFKSYFPKSRKLHKFVSRWRKEHHGSNPFMEFNVVDFNGILAYDAVYALAMAVEKAHTKFTGVSLIDQMSSIRFRGLGGEFNLINARTASNAIEVINVFGNDAIRVGFWMVTGEFVKDIRKTNSTFNRGLQTIVFPGGRTSILKRRRLQMKDNKLKIIVPTFGFFPNLIQMDVDPVRNLSTVSGYCGDVFYAAFNALNYEVDIEFTEFPFEDGRTYNELIDKVYFKEFDAAVGDITIISNRTRYVDFTLPFSDMGVGTVTRNAKKNMWVFLDPLSADLWLTSAGFFLFLGFVIWFIEHRSNEEFQGTTSQQIGITLWFAFSTLVYAHPGEKLRSNLSRFVVTVWVFVVLVLTSSYTATLSSVLTVQRIKSTGGTIQLPGISDIMFNTSSIEQRTPAGSAEGLRSGKLGAIIDEILYVKSFLSLYSTDEFSLVATATNTNGFGFVFQKDSPLTREMSAEIAKLREDGTLKALEEKWLKQRSSLISKDQSTPPPTSLDLYGLRGLFLTSALSMALALLGSIVYLIRDKWHERSKMAILRCILRRSPTTHAQESDREPTD